VRIILRTKDLFEKTCRTCGQIFRTDKARAYVCPICQRKTANDNLKSYRKKAKDKSKIPAISITEMTRIIENYNREHKTRYTYGQFCAKVNSGEITLPCSE